MLELYHHGTSVCASKVRFLLAAKGLEYTGHVVDLTAGEQQSAEYLKLNPKGVVPTLVHDSRVIPESNVICEYLEDAFREPALRPPTPYDRARMRLWTKQLDEDVHEQTSVISVAIAFRQIQLQMPQEKREAYIAKIPDPARRERLRLSLERGLDTPHFHSALRRFDKLLADMEAALQQGDWLAGSAFSLADIALAPYVTRLNHLQMQYLWETRLRVADWFERVCALDSYRISHTAWFLGNPMVEVMLTTGREAAERGRAILRGI